MFDPLMLMAGIFAGVGIAGIPVIVMAMLYADRKRREFWDINMCVIKGRDRMWDLYHLLRLNEEWPGKVNAAEWEEMFRAVGAVRAFDDEVTDKAKSLTSRR